MKFSDQSYSDRCFWVWKQKQVVGWLLASVVSLENNPKEKQWAKSESFSRHRSMPTWSFPDDFPLIEPSISPFFPSRFTYQISHWNRGSGPFLAQGAWTLDLDFLPAELCWPSTIRRITYPVEHSRLDECEYVKKITWHRLCPIFIKFGAWRINSEISLGSKGVIRSTKLIN